LQDRAGNAVDVNSRDRMAGHRLLKSTGNSDW
jgi:hypothetical protein